MPGHFSNTHRPKLGDKVTTSATIWKEHEPIDDSVTLFSRTYRRSEHRTVYSRTEQPVTGIFIGYRTLAEGRTGYDGDPEVDGGWVFRESRRFEAWLIITDPRRNPIYVLPEDVIGVNEHFPDDWRYFKHNNGGGYGSMRAVSRNGDQAATPDTVQRHFLNHGFTEITYLEYVALENAAERGDVR